MADQKARFIEMAAKMVLWASASGSAAIYSIDDKSQVGHCLLYVSAVLRTAFLWLMFFSQPEPAANDVISAPRASHKRATVYRSSMTNTSGLPPANTWKSRASVDVSGAANALSTAPPVNGSRLDDKMERSAQGLLALQFVYYVTCGILVLGVHIERWDYPSALPISEATFLGHLWNLVDGLSSFLSFYFGIRELQNAEVRGYWESYVIVEHFCSIVVNGSMLAFAAVSLCIDRDYGSPDFVLFSMSMACGTIEPIRWALSKPASASSARTTEMCSLEVS